LATYVVYLCRTMINVNRTFQNLVINRFHFPSVFQPKIINKIFIWVTVDGILMTLTMKCRGLLILLVKCILFPGQELDPW